MTDDFIKFGPEEVEQAFSDLVDEKINNTQFLEVLVQSKLFTMMDRPAEGALAADKNRARMMHFKDDASDDDMVALFTDPEEARKAREEAPDFEHLGRLDVLWALLHMDAHQGLTINSSTGRAFRIVPDGVAQLRATVQQALEQ